jgi:hypothetical protein
MTNDFQPFKQSSFEFVQHGHFAALFLTIEKAGRLRGRPGERRSLQILSLQAATATHPCWPAQVLERCLPVRKLRRLKNG